MSKAVTQVPDVGVGVGVPAGAESGRPGWRLEGGHGGEGRGGRGNDLTGPLPPACFVA